MSDERIRTRSELKRLFTNLLGKPVADEMMSIAIDSLWRDKINQRTAGFYHAGSFRFGNRFQCRNPNVYN